MAIKLEREIESIAEFALTSPSPTAFRERLLDVLERTIGFDLAKIQSSPGDGGGVLTCARGWDSALMGSHPASLFVNGSRQFATAAWAGLAIENDTRQATCGGLAIRCEPMQPRDLGVVCTLCWQDERGKYACSLGRIGKKARFLTRELDLLGRLLPFIKLAEEYLGARSRLGRACAERWSDRALRDGLSPRERAVTELVARGLKNREIARLLGISPATVRNHLASIFRKAEVTTRAELAFVCARSEA